MLDCFDGCPQDPDKVDAGDCGCGISDVDTDQDGAPDCLDECPDDPNKILAGVCGCNVFDADADEDGTPDCIDGCPDDADKVDPGECGCGVADTDSDGDGEPDCRDDTIRVPQEMPSIGEAIAVAPEGVTILVSPGVYNESLDFGGKLLTVEGDTSDPSLVVLDGTGLAGPIVIAGSGESNDTVLRGFTLRNGTAGGTIPETDLKGGGAVLIRDASPTIDRCQFDSNLADRGGAMAILGSADARVLGCIFSDNTGLDAGGAVFIGGASEARIDSCLFSENMSNGSGGAISLASGDVRIERSTITDNDAGTSGGGIFIDSQASLELGSTTVCDNAPDEAAGEYEDLGGNDVCADTPCPADLNGDGIVGGGDLGAFFILWGPCPDPCEADFDGNGEVDGSDLGLIFLAWGACP